MLSRWPGSLAAVIVTLMAVGLVIGDLADAGFRHWWLLHALTTDTVAGLLVLLITVLVADQVVRIRQVSSRSRAVSAQAAIMVGQAARSASAVSSVLNGSGDPGAASDEVRTYMIMLLVGAPVLIDARVSRSFLEEAQRLGGEMTWALTAKARATAAGASAARVSDAVSRVRAAAAPLLAQLNLDELIAAGDASTAQAGGAANDSAANDSAANGGAGTGG